MINQLLITFVCHCEKVWWDEGYESLTMAVRAFLDMQNYLSQKLGYKINSTFCPLIDHPTSDIAISDISYVPELFREIISLDNEVGLHIHGPIKEMNTGIQDRFIKSDTEFLTKLGFKPVTYAAGDWITSENTVPFLEKSGLKIDYSVYNLEPLREKFGAQRDYIKRKSLRPYHPDCFDICLEGKSKILELPVSGNLTEFSQVIYSNLPPITDRISDRYHKLDCIDIFQIFWHPFEIATLDGKDSYQLLKEGFKGESEKSKIGVNSKTLDSAKEFLLEFGQKPNVKILSAIRATEIFLNI
jgi:hypothetical protein